MQAQLRFLRRRGLGAIVLAAAMLAGCASTATPGDPLEGYNRAMFAFNEQVDKVALEPAARAYESVVPVPLRTGVGNFFGNLADPWIGLNNLLQGKVAESLGDFMRFAFNSTWGLFGVLDIAGEAGLAKHDEDLGQTLGRWGVGEGAYIVLPFFGPRTVRDALALPADLEGDSPLRIGHVPTRNTLTGVRIIHTRHTLLGAERTLEEATLDKYAYVRDFYLEQRRYKVSDGKQERVYEDFDDLSASPLGDRIDVAAVAAVTRLELARFGASAVDAGGASAQSMK